VRQRTDEMPRCGAGGRGTYSRPRELSRCNLRRRTEPGRARGRGRRRGRL